MVALYITDLVPKLEEDSNMGKAVVSKPKGANRNKQKVKLPPQQRAKDSSSWKPAAKVAKSVVKKKSDEQIDAIDRYAKKTHSRVTTPISLAPSSLSVFNKTADSSAFITNFDKKHLTSVTEGNELAEEQEQEQPVRRKKEPTKILISNRYDGLMCDSDSEDDSNSTIPLQPSVLAGMIS